MTAALSPHTYLAHLLARPHRPAGGAAAVAHGAARRRGGPRLALTVPTTRDEDWRFTDLAPLTRLSFQPAQAGCDRWRRPPLSLTSAGSAGAAGLRGRASSRPRSPQAARRPACTPAASRRRCAERGAAVEPHLGAARRLRRQVLRGAQHRRSCNDGAFVCVGRGVAAARPRPSAVRRRRRRTLPSTRAAWWCRSAAARRRWSRTTSRLPTAPTSPTPSPRCAVAANAQRAPRAGAARQRRGISPRRSAVRARARCRYHSVQRRARRADLAPRSARAATPARAPTAPSTGSR